MSSRITKHDQLSGRRSERVATDVPATLRVTSERGQTSCQVSAIDTSQHGVRIQSSFFSLAPGQTVELMMGEHRHSARGRVVWVRPSSSEHSLLLGIEILSIKP